MTTAPFQMKVTEITVGQKDFKDLYANFLIKGGKSN